VAGVIGVDHTRPDVLAASLPTHLRTRGLRYVFEGPSMLPNEHLERGATGVEYGIMIAAIAAVIVATVLLLGPQVAQGFQSVLDGWG